MRGLRSFLLGALAIGLVGYALAAAATVAAQAGGDTLAIAVGPVEFASVTEEGTATVVTFGPGLLLLAVVGGLANLVAAWAIGRRARAQTDPLD